MRFAVLLTVLAFPLLEIALLIKAGKAIGVLGVLAIIVLTAVVGVAAIRSHGLGAARRMAEALESGQELPEGLALDGALVVLAGGLLVAPGLITDTLGLVLLIPFVRRVASHWIARALSPQNADHRGWRASHRRDDVIEGEYVRVEERDVDPKP